MATHNHNIKVNAVSQFVAEQSDPVRNRFVFAYTVSIQNIGHVPAQLISRHWVITDATGHIEEVKGDGVIGEQPYLRPGESFRYTSGAVLETPVGTMHGSYQMLADDGQQFDAPIAAFRLAVPNALH